MNRLDSLFEQIRACRLCEAHLPLGPRPVIRGSERARLLIIGQAPGTRVHASGIPWDDPSGDRLRQWLGVDKATFTMNPVSPSCRWGSVTPARASREICRRAPNVHLPGTTRC